MNDVPKTETKQNPTEVGPSLMTWINKNTHTISYFLPSYPHTLPPQINPQNILGQNI